MASKLCRHCTERPVYKESTWCAECIYEICCRNYPRVNADGTIAMCVHGGRAGTIAAYLKNVA